MALPSPEQVEAITAATDRLARELNTLNGWAPVALQRLERLAGAIERARDSADREGPRLAIGVAQLAAELRHAATELDDGSGGGVLEKLATFLRGG